MSTEEAASSHGSPIPFQHTHTRSSTTTSTSATTPAPIKLLHPLSSCTPTLLFLLYYYTTSLTLRISYRATSSAAALRLLLYSSMFPSPASRRRRRRLPAHTHPVLLIQVPASIFFLASCSFDGPPVVDSLVLLAVLQLTRNNYGVHAQLSKPASSS